MSHPQKLSQQSRFEFKKKIEGDSKSIVLALKNGDRLNSDIGHLVIDTLSFVNSLRSWSFSHTYRQGNAIAHALARRARLCCLFEVWMENVSPDIFNVLQADLPTN